MKRTPCFLASSPSSCGSMITKRFLSYSKCRSIKGSVPLPIEPKPIMTMGPVIFAWICELMNVLQGMGEGRAPGSAAPFCGHFDLDLHLGLVEPGDDQQRCGRTYLAEHLAGDREESVRIRKIGDVVGRADDVGHREAALFQGRLDGLEAVA